MSKIATTNAAELSVPPPFAARLHGWSNRSTAYLHAHALTIVELALIAAWAAIVVGPYLNFDLWLAKDPRPAPGPEAA